ncbi:replication initiation factor domain-containing protein [Undibacterium sp.]|jgi:phage replication initiation protein|uniref:replication initiation factor domain-containing protein n=1 Tax=Undibacterium sp. TaxID=1914977 RepID=UPI002CF84B1C|nr:replication initiation factor domain-containing protein [Undibacterium sp.]HTD06232.1 replication initiation factor domain-containing protein [Undibacterium sp.]
MTNSPNLQNNEVPAATASGARLRARGGAAGTSPRPVKRGESLPTEQGVIVDWLRFTFLPTGAISHALEQMNRYFKLWFPLPVTMVASKRGLHGYQASHDVMAFIDGEMIRLAIVACGGDNVGGTICVDLSGTGCAIVDDWQAVYATMQDLDARITRCDLAMDFLDGECTIGQIEEMYMAGEFNSGGRIPKYYKHEGGDIHSLGCLGRTFEIGRRASGKLVRAYEKGKQLGNQDSNWLRIEIELHNKNRVIPHDVILKRAEYFAGAHKALEGFVATASRKIPTLQRQHESELARKLEHLRNQYGKTIDQASKFYSDDYASLIADIRVKGIPASMYKSALARHVYGSHAPETESMRE